MQAFLKNLHLSTPYNLGPLFEISAKTKCRLMTFSGFSLLMAFNYELARQYAVNDFNLKKERLQMPVYELKGEEAVNFPWNDENYDEWIYRPVKISGRRVYRHTAYIKNPQNVPGYDWILPVVTREPESADFDKREGILVNIGWIPAMFGYKMYRIHYFDTLNYGDFVGVLTPQNNLKKGLFQKESNSWGPQHYEINELDLGDMARAPGFLNQNKTQHFVLEVCNLDPPLDVDADQWDKNITHSELYPYVKTRAGILNEGPTPWDMARKEKFFFGLGSVSGLFALLAKVI